MTPESPTRSTFDVDPPTHLKRRVLDSLWRAGLVKRTSIAGVRAAILLGMIIAAMGVGYALGRPRVVQPADAPRFIVLLYQDSASRNPTVSAAATAEYGAWANELRQRGELELGDKLADTAVLLPVLAGAPVTLSASGSRLAGFFIIRAPDLQAATEISRTCPHLRYGTILIRPIEAT